MNKKEGKKTVSMGFHCFKVLFLLKNFYNSKVSGFVFVPRKIAKVSSLFFILQTGSKPYGKILNQDIKLPMSW